MPTTLQEWAWFVAIAGPSTACALWLCRRSIQAYRRGREFVDDIRSTLKKVTNIDDRTLHTETMQKTLFVAADTPGFRANERGEFVLVNRQLEVLTGFSERELLGMQWVNFIHPKDAKDFMESLHHALQDKRAFRRPFRLVRRDEDESAALLVCFDMQPMKHEEDDRLIGCLGTIELEHIKTIETRLATLEEQFAAFIKRRRSTDQ